MSLGSKSVEMRSKKMLLDFINAAPQLGRTLKINIEMTPEGRSGETKTRHVDGLNALGVQLGKIK